MWLLLQIKMTSKILTRKLSGLIESISANTSRFPEQIDEIVQLEVAFLAGLKRIEADEQRLSIGIMGQVKAGKSSFLNALLFDGKPILPEAATPKTANLTRISYGESPCLSVHYYPPEEWAEIIQDAVSDSESARARVARDLKQMVESNGIDVKAVLARQKVEVVAPNVDGLMDLLNDYVGENGKYTALVKFTEIQLPLPELDGFEITDTPGMNDPVLSRTQKTREYMAQCDVVFFLSRCSQFLDQSDMDLLAQQLPAEGVKRMVLVAGQFDGVIADDGYDRNSLAETEKNVRTRLARRAEIEIEKLAVARETLGDPKVAELLRGLKKPIFSSTFAHGYAHWDKSRWGKSMCHMHQELNELAESHWNGNTFTQDDWARLGNFDALIAAYNQARQDKQPLLQAQRDDLLPRIRSQLETRVGNLIKAAEHRSEQLKAGDIQSIEASAKACAGKIGGIANQLGSTINNAIGQAKQTAGKVRSELLAEIGAAAKVQSRTGMKKETTTYTLSTSTWYKPWTWGSEKSIEENSYVEYEYIAAADAVERVVNYANESATSLSRSFNNIISMSALRADLKRNLIDVLNTGSQEFNPAEFRITLESALNNLVLPELTLDLGDCSRLISGKFSGKVRNEKKMEALRQTLREALDIVFARLISALDVAMESLSHDLEQARDSLEEKLTSNLQAELSQLKKDFSNKEAEIRLYENMIKECQMALHWEPC